MKKELPKSAHHLALVLIIALIGAPWAAAPTQASTVYTINQSGTTPIVSGENSPLSDTVSGTITTDVRSAFFTRATSSVGTSASPIISRRRMTSS